MSYTIEGNTVTIKKDCKICSHMKVCKYHSKMKELCNSSEFYGMNEYLEWNNSLRAFELHASCGQFKLNFYVDDEGNLPENTDRNLIDQIIKLEMPESCNTYSPDHKNGIVKYRIKDQDDVIVKISDMLSKYKFPPKKK